MTSQYARNVGLINSREQHRFGESHVCIAGVGGVGGRAATRLAAMGVASFAIADPDTFDISNMNRQEGADYATLGRSKVEVIAERIMAINPQARVVSWADGISTENVGAFVEGADVVVDGIDYQQPELCVRLHQAARVKRIPTVVGVEVAYGAVSVWFPPDGKATFERFLGLRGQQALEGLASGVTDVPIRRWVPHIPRYIDLQVFREVAEGRIEAPAIAPAVDLCAAMLVTLVGEILTSKPQQPPAPAFAWVDVKERRGGISRHPTIHHYRTLARAAAHGGVKRLRRVAGPGAG